MTLVALVVVATLGAPQTYMVAPPQSVQPLADVDWIGEVVSDLLPHELALLNVPVIDRSDRQRAQESLEVPGGSVTHATSVRLAEALSASRLVLGTYSLEGSSVTVSLRVLDVGQGTLSAPFLSSGPVESLVEQIHSVAWDIALAGPHPPKGGREEARRQMPVSFEALKAYGQGLATRPTSARGKFLRSAVQLAPDFDLARLALARVQMDAGETHAALETLARIDSSSPVSRVARFLKGIALLEVGRYREASTLFASLIEEKMTAAALNNQAVALIRLGSRPVEPSKPLRQAIELEPASADLAFNLGWALLKEGQPEAASFWFRGVLRQEPLDARARVASAWSLQLAGKKSEADQEWNGVAALAPSFSTLTAPDLTRRFERILYSEQAVTLQREDRSDAEVAASLISRAERFAATGDHAGALRELNRAAYLDPYGPRVHIVLARVHRARGDREQAVNELRMALWSKDDVVARVELATVLREMGRVEEAATEARKALKLDPKNDLARRVLQTP